MREWYPLDLSAREAVLDVEEQPHQRLRDPDRLVSRHRCVNRVRIGEVLVDERSIMQAERMRGQAPDKPRRRSLLGPRGLRRQPRSSGAVWAPTA